MKLSFAQTFYKKIERQGFWLSWTILTVLGFWASLLAIEIGERSDLPVWGGSLGGGLIGLSQSLVLGFWLFDSWLWILTNLLAWGMLTGIGVGAIGWLVPSGTILFWRLIGGIFWGSLAGAWLGGWQWLYLRHKLPKAGQWILGMTIVWGLGLPIGWLVGGVLRNASQLFWGELVGLSVTWLIVGMGTGLILQRMMINPNLIANSPPLRPIVKSSN